MIIESLLDTDLYKFTMQQVVLHRFPDARVRFDFKCRNAGVDLTPYQAEIEREIDHLCTLRFSRAELEYLRTLRFLKPDFVEFLKRFQLDREFVHIAPDPGNGTLAIHIEGPWLHTILFEVPLLAIVNEAYFRNQDLDVAEVEREGLARLQAKIATSKEVPSFKFADFGTRRRFSRAWHERVVATLAEAVPEHLAGTSNVALARQFDLKPIGTMAHEFLQAAQALEVRLVDSQKYALEAWVQEYRGDLGIALSDVVGMDAFLRDFDLYFQKLFDGCRHDSGDPYWWCDKLLAHYAAHGIDASTKTAVFSDGLTFPRAIKLHETYKDRIRTSFGIGTNLTNDVGPTPLQIVIKMTECNGQPVAKVSDSRGKGMCRDAGFLRYLKQVFEIPDAPDGTGTA